MQSSAIVSVSNIVRTRNSRTARRLPICAMGTVDRLEAAFVAQALADLDANAAVVEIAVEIQQVRFDRHGIARKLRVRANAERGQSAVPGQRAVEDQRAGRRKSPASGGARPPGDDVRGSESPDLGPGRRPRHRPESRRAGRAAGRPPPCRPGDELADARRRAGHAVDGDGGITATPMPAAAPMGTLLTRKPATGGGLGLPVAMIVLFLHCSTVRLGVRNAYVSEHSFVEARRPSPSVMRADRAGMDETRDGAVPLSEGERADIIRLCAAVVHELPPSPDPAGRGARRGRRARPAFLPVARSRLFLHIGDRQCDRLAPQSALSGWISTRWWRPRTSWSTHASTLPRGAALA